MCEINYDDDLNSRDNGRSTNDYKDLDPNIIQVCALSVELCIYFSGTLIRKGQPCNVLLGLSFVWEQCLGT